MTLIDTFQTFFQKSSQAVFEWYTVFGRSILDHMHIFFDGAFNFFLFVAVIISLLYYAVTLYHFLPSKRRVEEKEPAFDWDKAPKVSIQIPTRNELAALNCARRCLEFDYPQDRLQIMIGDDSDMPDVSKQLQAFADEHETVTIYKREKNVGYKPGNLNNMLPHTKGVFLVIFDSDFLPEEDFMRRIIAPFQYDDNLAVVQARWKPINPNENLVTILGASIMISFHHLVCTFMQDFAGHAFLLGSAEAIRVKDLHAIGGWRQGSLTEDIEGSLRLIQQNKHFIYLRDLEVEMEVPFDKKDLFKQQLRWAYGVAHTYKLHLKGLLTSGQKIKRLLAIFTFPAGFFFSFILSLLFFFGLLSFATHEPGPIDLARFFGETAINIALTSGVILTTIVATIREGRILRYDKLLLASFTYGLVVVYYVTVGIIKALTNQPMQWFILKKKGNESA